MSTSLQKIITELKTTALLPSTGIASVEEKKLNIKANSDTLLPKLFIKLDGYDYDKFLRDSATENYDLELIFINKDSENPITDLKTIVDNFLNELFNSNDLFTKLSQGGKIKLRRCEMSNDRDLYSKYGGEYASLKLQINNINSFGSNPCL
jgi:hypothetical protein